MTVNQVNSVPAKAGIVQETKNKVSNENKKVDKELVQDKEVVYEKSADIKEAKKTVSDYGKDAEIKYAADIAAVKEMQRALDKRMENSFLQMAMDSLGEQQTGLKAKLEEILEAGGEEITPQMIDEAKANVAEDGYFGVEATANRLVDFAKALSGENPEKAEMLKDAFMKGFEQAEELWGDDLPEISQKTKVRTEELFDEWKNN